MQKGNYGALYDKKSMLGDSELTLQFNSWPKNNHPTLTFLRKIAQTCRPGGPPSFL